MADEITPTTTSGAAPPSAAALNTANFPAKPEVSGIPAKASRNTANTAATSVAPQRHHGERADRHERVRRQVEEDGRHPVRRGRDDAREDESRVRDRRVRHTPL